MDTNIRGRKSIYASNNSTSSHDANSLNPWNDVNKIFNNSYENLDEKNITNIKVKEQVLLLTICGQQFVIVSKVTAHFTKNFSNWYVLLLKYHYSKIYFQPLYLLVHNQFGMKNLNLLLGKNSFELLHHSKLYH